MNGLGFLEHLLSKGRLSRSAARRAELASAQTGTSIENTLLEFGLLEEDLLFRELAEFLEVPYFSFEEIDTTLLKGLALPEDFLTRLSIIPAVEASDTLFLATPDPRGGESIKSAGFYLECPVEMAVVSPSTVKMVLANVSSAKMPENEGIAEGDIERLTQLANDGPVIKLVNDLIAQAVALRASDIHIEAGEVSSVVRFRIDGVLQARESVPQVQRAAVVSRLKVMANLNISEKRRPQDGRAQLSVRGRNIDIRLSTLPTQFGESIVMRLLDRTNLELSWNALGFEAGQARSIEQLVRLPNGIFLVAGPTGSGKTTTLYTALDGLNTAERKIITVEDPVEYSLNGVNQVQVDPNVEMGFAQALRAILRQDPDTIMVGEIRDAETAEIAVRAALVGRMVLSTIHTNDALSAVPRLLDLGVPPYLLSATLRGVLSQRLVRRVCAGCCGGGCSECESTGTSGRRVLSELLVVGDGLGQAISEGQNLDKLRLCARSEGFEDIEVRGQKMISEGQALKEDVLRALGSFAL